MHGVSVHKELNRSKHLSGSGDTQWLLGAVYCTLHYNTAPRSQNKSREDFIRAIAGTEFCSFESQSSLQEEMKRCSKDSGLLMYAREGSGQRQLRLIPQVSDCVHDSSPFLIVL